SNNQFFHLPSCGCTASKQSPWYRPDHDIGHLQGSLADRICFYALKQNLKVETSVGTGVKALCIQIWTFIDNHAADQYMQFKSKLSWAPADLVGFLALKPFTYGELWEQLIDPYQVPPITSVPFNILFR